MEHSWLSRITGISLFVGICIALVISFSARTTATASSTLSARDATLSFARQDVEVGSKAQAPLAVAVDGGKAAHEAIIDAAVSRRLVVPARL